MKLDATHPAVQELAGQVFWHVNKPTKAAQQFSELVRTHPDHSRGHFKLGLSLVFAGKVEEALPELSRAIQQELKLIAPLGSVALALDQTGQTKVAGILVQFIQMQAPESAVGPYVAGMLAWQRGEKPLQNPPRCCFPDLVLPGSIAISGDERSGWRKSKCPGLSPGSLPAFHTSLPSQRWKARVSLWLKSLSM